MELGTLLHLVGKVEASEVLSFLLQTLPALLNSLSLFGEELLDFADNFESLLLYHIFVESNFVVFVQDLESLDFLVDCFTLLNRY